jgi:hypothetical protein
MEVCYKKEPIHFIDLKKSLYMLHSLKIIHGDIKH